MPINVIQAAAAKSSILCILNIFESLKRSEISWVSKMVNVLVYWILYDSTRWSTSCSIVVNSPRIVWKPPIGKSHDIIVMPSIGTLVFQRISLVQQGVAQITLHEFPKNDFPKLKWIFLYKWCSMIFPGIIVLGFHSASKRKALGLSISIG